MNVLNPGRLSKRFDEIQDMLDAGMTIGQVAATLCVHHEQIRRLVSRGAIEIYVAFDEVSKTSEPPERRDYEDEIDRILSATVRGDDAVLPDSGPDNVGFYTYLSGTYGGIRGLLDQRDMGRAESSIMQRCTECRAYVPLTEFRANKSKASGIERECRKCAKERWTSNYPKYRDACLMSDKRRRARLRGLPFIWDAETQTRALADFGGRCALTGSTDYHFDHVIPIATGRGGTYYGNMIPLRSDLNLSKNDANIIEWFETNRQRFELSQERFDVLIAKLAQQNEMTIDVYRKWVYSCHEDIQQEVVA